MKTLIPALAAGALILAATPAGAEVVERSADHFVLRYETSVATTHARLEAAAGSIDRWWDGAHTYTGDAANLSLPLAVGACFCEAMPDGTAFEHGRVTEYGEMGLLLDAPLGPLKGRATTAQLGIGWAGVDPDWALVMTFVVRGPGLGAMADGVDRVMQGQFDRLSAYVKSVETPDAD